MTMQQPRRRLQRGAAAARVRLGRALLMPAVALGLVASVVFSGPAFGQDIKLVAGDGCLSDKAPTAPQSLKAKAKDGKVILSWAAPANGACVDTYVVNVIDPIFRSSTPSQTASTGRFTTTIDNLQNDRPYSFQVQAYSAKFKTGGISTVSATPNNRCLAIKPGTPTNVRMRPSDGMAQLCWDGVDNDACIDEYRVSATRVDGPSFRSSDGTISKGGCANISSLQNDVQYKFSVVPYSNKYGEGPGGSTIAVVGAKAAGRNGFTCKAVDGCHPDRLGLCARSGCDAVARAGQCRAPAVTDVDWVNREVTQWCGFACSCDVAQITGQGLGLAGLGGGRPSSIMDLGALLGDGETTSVGVGSIAGGGGGLGGGGGSVWPGLPAWGATTQQRVSAPSTAASSAAAATVDPVRTSGATIGGVGVGVGGGGFGQTLMSNMLDSNLLGQAAGKMVGEAVQARVEQQVGAIMGQIFRGGSASTAGGP